MELPIWIIILLPIGSGIFGFFVGVAAVCTGKVMKRNDPEICTQADCKGRTY